MSIRWRRAQGDPPSPRTLQFALLAAFTTAAGSFVAATAISQSSEGEIRHAAAIIAENAAPSIERVAAVRAELSQLELDLDNEVDALFEGKPFGHELVQSARRAVDEGLRAYLAQPRFPHENVLQTRFEAELRALDSSIDRLMAAEAAGRPNDALACLKNEIRPAMSRVDVVASQIIDFNASHVRELAQGIDVIRRRSTYTSLVLDGLSCLIVAVVAILVQRITRQTTGALERNRRLSEERADELDRFAGRVAHDIRGPLGTVSFAVEVAARKVTDNPGAQEALARAQRQLGFVSGLVTELLDFARSGARPAPGARADFGEVLSDVVSEIGGEAERAGVAIVIAPFRPCAVAIAPPMLGCLLANLARNAIKYMGDAEVRRITVRVVEDRGEGASRVRCEVEDTGPGVPAEHRDAIFELYVRGPGVKAPGLGLGLATVKRIAEAYGGSAGLAPGAPSTFWFELPRAS